jgi:hypothetical protein
VAGIAGEQVAHCYPHGGVVEQVEVMHSAEPAA